MRVNWGKHEALEEHPALGKGSVDGGSVKGRTGFTFFSCFKATRLLFCATMKPKHHPSSLTEWSLLTPVASPPASRESLHPHLKTQVTHVHKSTLVFPFIPGPSRASSGPGSAFPSSAPLANFLPSLMTWHRCELPPDSLSWHPGTGEVPPLGSHRAPRCCSQSPNP